MREALHLTQQQVADLLLVDRSTVLRMEGRGTGHNMPRYEALLRSRASGTSVSDITETERGTRQDASPTGGGMGQTATIFRRFRALYERATPSQQDAAMKLRADVYNELITLNDDAEMIERIATSIAARHLQRLVEPTNDDTDMRSDGGGASGSEV